ncbi:MAG TPA: hypothetical protein DGT21_09150 [Armatimonadetes bacterium]|jgi:ferredoxin|nr:hypothetical protein [Armatimonadota bacterium]
MNTGRLIRRISQLAFLIAFVWLLWAAQWPLGFTTQPDLFLRADPLAALLTVLAAPHFPDVGSVLSLFWPALVLLGLTAVLGRFYCGWVCPLGTCIDVFHRLAIYPLRRADSRRAEWVRVKYVLLVAAMVAALLGTQVGWWFDPIPLLTRAGAMVMHPLLQRIGVWMAHSTIGPVAAAAERLGAPVLVYRGFEMMWTTGVVLLIVLSLSYVSRRYWCRNLCPLGALLAFVGRFGLWRRLVDADACAHCNRCVTDCKTGAIRPHAPEITQTPECVLCYNCLNCGKGATRIGLSLSSLGLHQRTDMPRRRVLEAVGAGLLYSTIVRYPLRRDRGPLSPRAQFLIRPPGALLRSRDAQFLRTMDEEEFRARCIRCGECMKVCPTNVLQPATLEAGFDGLFTPTLVASMGFCKQSCTACGEVCPSGALRPFDSTEKPEIKIALARIDHSRCLSWQKGDRYTVCLICEQSCPYGAITADDIGVPGAAAGSGVGQLRPVVHPDACVGCGMCEFNCPVGPEAAIRIYRLEAPGGS